MVCTAVISVRLLFQIDDYDDDDTTVVNVANRLQQQMFFNLIVYSGPELT